MMRRIVCAAIRCENTIILGARHWDKHMHFAAEPYNLDSSRWEQGFIDQRGNFLTREEAFVVATEAGQIIRRCGGDEGRLFSENLY